MKAHKKNIICVGLIIFFFSPVIMQREINSSGEKSFTLQNDTEEFYQNLEQPVLSSQKSNYEIIDQMLSSKLAQYSSLGYFPQVYESSLQATYFALYILDAVGHIDQINQTAVLNFIMSHYDENSQIFNDKYSKRYLESDIALSYTPFTSILEVNCYAILSLNILGRLDLINIQQSINFIWSCYNPFSSGFIGQPFNINLDTNFRISTMDNTYYALKTLNLLLASWSSYTNQKSELITYINSLQNTNPVGWQYGGFYNDNNSSFNSLGILFEPNLLSSYYCIKSLEMFGMINSINVNSFNQFLDSHYNPGEYYFRISQIDFSNNFTNIIATAIGLELSSITGFSSISRNNVVNFIINNRNQIGIWDQSTTINSYELIDTFQVIRSLKDSGEMNHITSQEKAQIASSINLFYFESGYSLISKDHTSIDLLSSIINSFHLFGRVSDLDILSFYNDIENSYLEEEYFKILGFAGYLNFGEYYQGFRSYPIKFYGSGHYLRDHRFTYMALDSLQKIFKLDDFSLKYDLMKLVDSIIGSQFLDTEFDSFGTFLPLQSFTSGSSEFQDQNIFFEYSFYAIKCLELLANFLNLGKITDLPFNKGALYGYITRNIFLINDMINFNPHGASDPETILQHNYYMVYILKALNLFDLDLNNITHFILQKIDYENIKNIYYCYKINEILDLNLVFDVNLTSRLVGQLFSDNINEFYESRAHQKIDQDIFLWICEMARNDDIYIQCVYEESVNLGSVNTITASFCNLIFTEYGQLTSVIFESDQLGTLNLEKQFDNSYQISFMVPEDPKFYPNVEGMIMIYDYSKIIGEVPVSFQTNFEQIIDFRHIQNSESTSFMVNVSRKFSSQVRPVFNSSLIADVLIDNLFLETTNFTREDFTSYSKFNLDYEYKVPGNHSFKVYLVDKFFPEGLFLFEYDTQSNQENPEPQKLLNANGDLLAVVGVVITIGLVALVIKGGRWVKKKAKTGDRGEVLESEESTSQKNEINDKLKVISFEDYD
jgi:prenyltransferase beta subunit